MALSKYQLDTAQPTAPDSVAVGATVSKVAVTLPAVTAGELATMFEVARRGHTRLRLDDNIPSAYPVGPKRKN
jgi:hypothetical protein